VDEPVRSRLRPARCRGLTSPDQVTAPQRPQRPGQTASPLPGKGPPDKPPAAPVIQRKVSSRGAIRVARQRVQVSLPHAGRIVSIELSDTTLRVIDPGGELLATVPSTSTGEISRFKAHGSKDPDDPAMRPGVIMTSPLRTGPGKHKKDAASPPLIPGGDRSSLCWPDSQGAVGTAVLQEAGLLKGEAHVLTCMKLPVARHFDVGEVDETAAGHLRSLDYTPALVSIEPLDHTRHCTRPPSRLSHHGLIVPSDSSPKPWRSAIPPPFPVPTPAHGGLRWRFLAEREPVEWQGFA
jgi:hypothetical protein